VDDLGDRIRALPGADRLLPALDGLAPAWLVGGAVRDLLLGAGSVDLDVAIEGDARSVARELASRLDGEAREHERFGTATVRAGGLTVDLASTRRETYPQPGALPEVAEASLDEDLARRDFTVNAIAASLAADRVGELRDPHGGRADLDAGVIRVLHPRSFADDPTRLLRAVRYESRLGFRMDPETERLAREAIAAGALSTVSGARIRDELLDLLGETNRPSASARGRCRAHGRPRAGSGAVAAARRCAPRGRRGRS
jgi:tRNA nucleotidyltransferase (CCA-adding enzyme)